jgi:hypothetical protein
VSDQGFIGEAEARLRISSRWEITVVRGSRQPREVCELRVVSSHPVKTSSVRCRLYVCYSSITFGVCG